MIFDAFSITLSMIPDHVAKAYKCNRNCLFVFSDSTVNNDEIKLLDGTLSIHGSHFSYMSMSEDSLKNFTPCQIIIHKLSIGEWNALITGFKSTYKSFLDQDAIINDLKDLPILNEEAMIDFFVDEIFFSPNNGVMPIGIALLDSAVQKFLPRCIVNTTYYW